MSKLVFKIGEETIPTVLGHNDYLSSPFADQLASGRNLLVELLEKWSLRDPKSRGANLDSSEQPVVNNIIAFLGERGSGKTSCLYSLKEIFANDDNNLELSKQTEFLPIIDPSFFDEHHNILEIFIGELYHEYEKIVKPWEQMPNTERQKVRNLHGSFSKVRQSIKFLNVQKLELPEEEEGLSALSEGVNLRLLVSELVNAYLKCKKKKYLVVSIDDIDLNIREAYRMMEQIRKYLVVPNVVILMAAKLKQLKNSITLNLTEYYKAILPSVIDIHSIQTMADRYIDKFIPLERRIFMPTLTDYSSAQLDIIDKGELNASDDNMFESVEFAVLSLIYEKCGYLFYNYEETPSLIIPETLRELRSFVTMLFEMDGRDNLHAHIKNKSAFKDYFQIQWLQRLPSEQQEIARNILKEKDLTKINKTVVALLHEYAISLGISKDMSKTEKTERINLTQIRLKEIENSADYSENISIGDVMAVIDHLNGIAGAIRINYLVFFVTTYYSVRLYELYDAMTDDIDKKSLSIKDRNGSETDHKLPVFPKLKSSKDYRIYDYFKIIGNSFFTLTGQSFLPPASNRAYSRELSLMNGSLLFDVIDGLVNEFKMDDKAITTQDFIGRLNLAEFFMLCASRMIESRDGSYSPFVESNWRADSSDFYFYPFDSGMKTILFDITAPFVNLCLPKKAYARFSEKIVDIALKCKDSLLNKLYKEDKRPGSEDNEHNLLSRAAIRNTEVLRDINLWLIKNKEKFQNDKDNDLEILAKFFNSFNGKDSDNNGYAVRTYELNKGRNDFHTINFTPFRVLSSFLDSIVTTTSSNVQESEKGNKELEDLFMRIYRKESLLAADTLYSLPELIRILRDSKETEIPAKDAVITKVMKRSKGRILSNLLVEYLAEIDIVEKVLFSTYFDVALFNKYRSFVTDNLNQHQEYLEGNKNELEHRLSAFIAEKRRMETEHKQIDVRIASVKKRLNQERSSVVDVENNIKKHIMEIENINKKVDSLNSQLSNLRQELIKLDSIFKGYNEEQNSLERELHQKERDLLSAKKSDDKSELMDEIKKIRRLIVAIADKKENQKNILVAKSKEIDLIETQMAKLKEECSHKESDISKHKKAIQNLNTKIEQDEAIFDNLYAEAKMLKQRESEIKAAVLTIETNMNRLFNEYSLFKKKRDSILSFLNNGAS